MGGAAALDPAVADHPPEGLVRPALPYRRHFDVAVEMNVGAGAPAFPPRHHVGARIARRIPRLALRPVVADLEAARLQARAEILRAGRVGLARRIDRGDADEIAGESDEVVALGLAARQAGRIRSARWRESGGQYV